MRVTPLSLGAVWIGYTGQGWDDDLAAATVVRALELGINLIDSSPMYQGGHSERRVGLGIRAWCSRGGKREDVHLCTKTGTRVRPYDYSGDHTLGSVEESLRLLGTDYLDICLVHDPDSLDPVFAPGGALDVLKQLKDQKVVRAIGLGVRSHDLHRQAIETGEFEVLLTYRDFNLLTQSARDDILPLAERHDVGVFNGTPTIKGLLAGRDPRVVAEENRASGAHGTYQPTDDEVDRAAALWEFARSEGTDLLSLNLQYCRREPRVTSTLVGASRPEEIEQDVAAITRTIPEQVWQKLADRFGL